MSDFVFIDYMIDVKEGKAPPYRPWQEKQPILSRVLSALPLSRVTADYADGIDLSKWNVSWDVQKSIDAGIKYAFIKASQNTFVDPKFDEFANAATVANFDFGCYHFADPWGKPPVEQARFFSDVTKGVGTLSLVMDEEWHGDLSPTGLSNWGRDFMQELDVLQWERLKEMYTRQSFHDPNVAVNNWCDDYGLWAARWAEWLDGPWSDGKFVFRDWNDWVNWQTSGDGNRRGYELGVGSPDVDTNRFHGTWEEMQIHYGLLEQPPTDFEALVAKLKADVDVVNADVLALEAAASECN